MEKKRGKTNVKEGKNESVKKNKCFYYVLVHCCMITLMHVRFFKPWQQL